MATNTTLKTEYKNYPVSMPAKWKEALTVMAGDLGVSQNTIFLMGLKIGAPVLRAFIAMQKKVVRGNCRMIADGGANISKILGTDGFSFPGVEPLPCQTKKKIHRQQQPTRKRR
ncbi:MAG: hypothetical protein ACXWIU_02325 [Limisphaerales bacterium]